MSRGKCARYDSSEVMVLVIKESAGGCSSGEYKIILIFY